MTLYTNHGTGDTYMTFAFAHHTGRPVVYGNPNHAAIAAMFPHVPSSHGSVGEVALHVHPEHAPPLGLSRYALLGRPTTHADLWRGILQLPLDAEMRRGKYLWTTPHPKTALLIREARSWPNAEPGFWSLLEHYLNADGWTVLFNEPRWTLDDLFFSCAMSEWVIGPQCGVMMILCHVGFPCRKTFATQSVDNHPYFRRTWPYASVSTFAGEDYDDVDEVIIRDVGQAAAEVMTGANARRLERRPTVVSGMQVTLSYGDFFDRLSILDVKQQVLSNDKRALMLREYLRMREYGRPFLSGNPILANLYADLLRVNREAFEQNDVAVRTVLEGGAAADHYARAVHLNKQRTELKERINVICGSAFHEVKSYYD